VRIIEKGLQLDKVDFSKKGYMINKRKFPRIPDKAASSSRKEKEKVDEPINISEDEDEDIMGEEEPVNLDEDLLKSPGDQERMEAETGGSKVPLVGVRLGGAVAGEDQTAEFGRAIFHCTPPMFFTPEGLSNQAAVTPYKLREGPFELSQEFLPPLLPNLLKRKKGSTAAPVAILRLLLPAKESEALYVVSQASASIEGNPKMGDMKSFIKEMFAELKTSQKEMAQ
jgi:hypothetical protein